LVRQHGARPPCPPLHRCRHGDRTPQASACLCGASAVTTSAPKAGPLAVFDLGKTNSKLFVFAPDGKLLDERRTKPVWTDFRGRGVLDDEALFSWMSDELADVTAMHGVTGLMI